MPQTNKKPAAAPAEPKPTLLPPANPEESERAIRLRRYDAESKQLLSLKRFHGLEENTWDLACVLALADLFNYHRHDADSMDDSPNWLGSFFAEVLLEVAANGPEWANAHPEFVKAEFDKAIENLRDSLEFCREIGKKIGVETLDLIEKWQAFQPS